MNYYADIMNAIKEKDSTLSDRFLLSSSKIDSLKSMCGNLERACSEYGAENVWVTIDDIRLDLIICFDCSTIDSNGPEHPFFDMITFAKECSFQKAKDNTVRFTMVIPDVWTIKE